jgi:hypothetical protein
MVGLVCGMFQFCADVQLAGSRRAFDTNNLMGPHQSDFAE